ncbi:hypothetical protein [Antrihabitans sp. YC2-6]|uniref:hypothetical protein n=1 Tax=Antrihabitans sp. YC2-6 TaxID=2799498 RepID=UPI0018F4F48B|nr:hypothetical protein [Antrihabitans sp. YC2-6]MBJ8346151.1 hypothetical protein [Antrihabitans sp. YC2-6]
MLTRFSTVQERFERTGFGKFVISFVAVAIILIGLTWSIPNSPIKQWAIPFVRPVAIAGGLDQSWSVFAPDPPRSLNTFEVHVLMADQTMRPWNVPRGNPIWGHYDWYRFQKLKEWILTPNSGINMGDFIHWVVREVTYPGESPVLVELVSKVESLPPPGTDVAPTEEFHVLYQEILAGRP